MSASTPGVWRISVDSNLASGIAALVFDILLLGIIKWQCQALCKYANLFLLYDRRQPILPGTSKIGALTGGPIGPINLARLFSFLIMLSTASIVVLGFCINGRTVTAFRPQIYAVVVNFTNTPLEIDFSNEFELKCSGTNCTRMVSKRLYAMEDMARCKKSNYSHTKIYSYAYKELILDAEKQELGSDFPGGICVTEENFREPMILREYGRKARSSPVRCRFSEIQNPFRGNGDINDVREAEFVADADECEPEVKHLSCFKSDTTACAGWGQARRNEKTGHYVVLVPDITTGENNGEVVQVSSLDNEEQQKKAASNVAFLSAVGFQGSVSNLANMAVSDILVNKTLDFLEEGGQNISEVDLNLATPAFAVLAATTLLLAVLVFVSWICVVVLKGRRGYKTFCSIPQILQLVCTEKASKMKSTVAAKRVIGVSRRGPHLSVYKEGNKEECSDWSWEEPDVY